MRWLRKLLRKNCPTARSQTGRRDWSKVATALTIIAAGGSSGIGSACAQDLEPRAYSASPIGTNFLVSGYTRTTGGISLDPSLPITGVRGTIDSATLGYDRTFDLAGRSASVAIQLPYVHGDFTGQVEEQSSHVSRSGLGDLRMRFAVNLFGAPALTPAEFQQRPPTTTLGTSLTIIAPTGEYNPQRLINISSNRFAFKPELGVSQPLGDWFVEAYAGAWVFTNNGDFFGGHVRSQAPLWAFQAHAGYNFRPGLWLAADATYYTGGETSIDGAAKHGTLATSRYGLTLSVPIGAGFSAKLAWSTWLRARNGGTFQTIGVALQFRW